MLKHIYRSIVLVIVFVVSIFFMGNNIKEEAVESSKTTTMATTTFPVMYIETEKGLMNPLHGYSTNIDANMLRETITLLDTDQAVNIYIDQKKTNVKKINYEIRDCGEYKLIEGGSISALTQKEGAKTAKIKIKESLQDNAEYAMKITGVTSTGKKIYFYTRVKKITDAHLNEKYDFAMSIHEAIIKKDKDAKIGSYLETNATMDNTTYAYVNIHSSYDMVMWGKLKPTITTDVLTRITEMNRDTASFVLQYKVEVETDTGIEEYTISEFFRVKYTPARMYLLYYERKAEAIFNPDYISVKKGELKLGVSNEYELSYLTDDAETKLGFVRNKTLWYYDMIANSMVRVFSFQQDNSDFIRDCYDHHDIKILNIDADGNIDFVVYGYMNRGEYEGRTAVILYRYTSVDNRVEEQVYIPMTLPYEVMKEDLEGFSYVNHSSVFYFSLENRIFSYNMITKELTTIVEEANQENLMVSQKESYIAWADSSQLGEATNITLLDLETGVESKITAKKGQSLRIFGKIDENLIYGYVKDKNLATDTDGSILAPAYKVSIIDKQKQELKSYSVKNYYTVAALVTDNVIELKRVKKSAASDTGYKATESDYILNRAEETRKKIEVTTRVTDKMLTELYLSIPDSIELTKKPDVKGTVNTVIKDDRTLRIDLDRSNQERYYVYALGEVLNVYDNAGEAVVLADEKMGSVINQNFKVIWERGKKSTRASLSGITPVYSSAKLNSKKACAKMLLANAGVNVTESQLGDKKRSIMDILTQYMKKEPVNLTGCTLEEVLYYISEGRAVIAIKNNGQAVLLTEYDEFNVTMVDPELGRTWKEGYKDSSKMFEEAGNIFISYVE
ncbi:hypothetical protein [Anaerosporobacter faecicola]|uniref:hypothetical protein n=1 Tax=Anaerosporobacter faecicola TaxID=2718714 RepID=UPI001439799E|nr:hypothetical protein [Anaerosporobacter faecicola]